MSKPIKIKNKIHNFDKEITVNSDKSLSIRFAILASMANGKSRAFNLSRADDIKSTLNCLKKLGVVIKFKKKYCEIVGNGISSYTYKKNLTLDAGNSGTAARLIISTLINSPNEIKITGDQSLRKRDMKRIIEPLQKFGATFTKNNGTLPLYIKGSQNLRSINYKELKGSAQVKSACCLAALNAPGTTKLKCKPSRNHTEIMLKYLGVPIKVKKTKKFDHITINGQKKFKSFNYIVPGDISSASFFIVLTLLSKNSQLKIKNVNVNTSRTGIISILKMMGAKISLNNKKKYKGELVADIFIKSARKLKGINCPIKFNSATIDEFLLLFLVSSLAKGISTYRNLQELNKKESKRLDWGIKILKMIGVKVKKIPNCGIKIWGKPNLELKKKYIIKDYLKDHRIFMTSTVAALTMGGEWEIHDLESANSSFPNFLKKIKQIGGKIN